MHHSRNSPVHRTRNLLCGDISESVQSVNPRAQIPIKVSRDTSGYPPSLQPLVPSNLERPTSLRSLISMPSMDSDSHIRMFDIRNTMASGYYVGSLATDPQHPSQIPYYCPFFDSTLTTGPYDPPIPIFQPMDTANFGGIFSESIVTPQPPIPPAAPGRPTPSNPTYYFYSCRWLGGPHCDGLAPGRNREMGEHLRVSHHFLGHERDLVQCEWESCGQIMQRMNIPRHIVSRHLLASASCRFCRRRFSRPDVVARHERTCSGVSSVSNSPVSGI